MKKILTFFGIFIFIVGCSTSTHDVIPTLTATVTPTFIATLKPTPTYIPTQTPFLTPTMLIRSLDPVRPVSNSVPLYHEYGIPIEIDQAHNGYDYGFQNCAAISYPILSIESGKIMQLGGDGDIWIDHGDVQLSDGSVYRVISTYWHIQYNKELTVGMQIEKRTPIAYFPTCQESGHSPELELQMIRVDPQETNGLDGQSLLEFLQKNNYQNGEFTHFDPLLIGLPPN